MAKLTIQRIRLVSKLERDDLLTNSVNISQDLTYDSKYVTVQT